jgi:hypothetical protein
MGVTGVLARISELQTQLGVTPPATTTAGTTTFASALADATGTTAGARTGVTGEQVVAAARKYLGTPYVFGGSDPGRGLDCSALVQRAYRDLGIELPRTSREQARAGTAVGSLEDAQPGDLLAFNSPVDHIAIYVGDNKMIAAPKPGDQVKIQSVYETPTAIRRVLGPDTAAAAFVKAGARYDVSPKLLAAVAKVESGYNPKAVSPAGAQGLMQLMPATARGLGVKNSFDPEQAVNGAAKLLAGHLKEFKSVPLALAAYNAGGGAVHRYGGIPPFAETQAYVPKVQKALAKLG